LTVETTEKACTGPLLCEAGTLCADVALADTL
jgi:hypothetical protein